MKFCLAVLVLSTLSQAASATSLFGNTVRITAESPIGTVTAGPVDAVVGPGIEAAAFQGIYNINLDDTTIAFTFPGSCCGGFSPAAFNGIHIFDLNGTIDKILSVTIGSNNVSGFTAARISFDQNNIFVNFQGLDPNPATGLVSLNVVVAPEPSTIFGVAAGLAALAVFARRRLFA